MKQIITRNQAKNEPFVSVIMPVYNAQKYLKEAIESILDQTYGNFELIIVDDRSSDNSWRIIKKYQKANSKVKAYRVKKTINYAGNGAFNWGYRFAKGEYIARMDADDIAYKDRLKKQVKFLEKNPEYILVGSQAHVIDSEGKQTGEKKVPENHEKIYKEYGVVHPVIHPTVMLRRSLLPRSDVVYESKFGINSDYYTFFRFLNFGKFANLPGKLLKYRVHAGNFSYKKPKERFVNSLKIRIKAIEELNYRISMSSILIMMIQAIVVSVLPEKAIVPVYLGLKGMLNPKEVIKNFFNFKKLYTPVYSRILSRVYFA